MLVFLSSLGNADLYDEDGIAIGVAFIKIIVANRANGFAILNRPFVVSGR